MFNRRAAAWLWHEHRRFFIGVAVLLAGLGVLLIYLPELQAIYRDLQAGRAHGPALYVSFGGLLVLAALTSVFPASILGVLAGMLFGLVNGFLLSSAAFMIAALLAFVFGRYFFRKGVRRLVAKAFDLDRLEARLARHGWRYALHLRLAPIAPFGITSYGLGLTPLGLVPYLLTTLGTLPFLLLCVYLGSVGHVFLGQGDVLDRQALTRLAILYTVATIAMAIVVHFLTRWARQRLVPAGEDQT